MVNKIAQVLHAAKCLYVVSICELGTSITAEAIHGPQCE